MRLSSLPVPEPDGIFALMRACAEDTRAGKVDLGVGVYRDAQGHTPVMAAVKEAERRLWEAEQTKAYVGFSGDPAFADAIRDLVLGPSIATDRVSGAATNGGTGAVHHAFSLSHQTSPNGRIWIPEQSWPNHAAILEDLRLSYATYRHHDPVTGALDTSGQSADLAKMRPDDTLLLHGCCHNPTGVDHTLAQWVDLAHLCVERSVLPIVDLAYIGFGQGLAEDVAGLRAMAALVPEMLVCVSGSKSFGLYRDRAGALLVLSAEPTRKAALDATLATLNRLSISFPPDHGARLTTMILADPDLRAAWESELTHMRSRIRTMRESLSDMLQSTTGDLRFAALRQQQGMFSLLPLSPDQMRRLRADHAIYGLDDGRINLAGLTEESLAPVANAIAAVLR